MTLHPVNDKRRWYREEYLLSDHWMELRARKIAESGSRCAQCDRDGHEVHHLRYRNIYDVQLADLVVLCFVCHRQLHAKQPPKWRKRTLGQRLRAKERFLKALVVNSKRTAAIKRNVGLEIAELKRRIRRSGKRTSPLTPYPSFD